MGKEKKSSPDIKKMVADKEGKIGLNNPNIPKMKNPPPPPPKKDSENKK